MNKEKANARKMLRTCEGQIRGIINMIDDERYCVDISNQIMASQALLKKANGLILSQHIHNCVFEAMGDEEQAEVKLKEIEDILKKLLK